MEFHIKKFKFFSVPELYKILQLRSEVFVVEQTCIYQDLDGKDAEAIHIFAKKNGEIVAYARCFEPGIYFEEAAIGRVVVKKSERKNGIGHAIFKTALDFLNEKYPRTKIRLSAQQYLIGFYESHGFETSGDGYLEDGIPHILMVTKLH